MFNGVKNGSFFLQIFILFVFVDSYGNTWWAGIIPVVSNNIANTTCIFTNSLITYM